MSTQSIESHQARLLYRLAPVDIGINMIAAAILVAIHFESLRLSTIQPFMLAVATICGGRFLFLLIARLTMDKKTQQLTGLGTALLWLGTFTTGAAWGSLPLLMPDLGLSGEVSQLSIAFIIAALMISALAGSGMRNDLWLAFAFPATLIPLAHAIWLRDTEHGIIWGFLFVIAFILTRANAGSSGMGTQLRKLAQHNIQTKAELAQLRTESVAQKRRIDQLSDALLKEQQAHERIHRQATTLEEEMKAILLDIRDVYFRCDKEGYITQISRGIEDLIGMSADELLGTEFKYLFSSDQVYNSFAEALDNKVGILRDYKTSLRHRFNRDVWVSINARYLKNGLAHKQGLSGLISFSEKDDHLDISI